MKLVVHSNLVAGEWAVDMANMTPAIDARISSNHACSQGQFPSGVCAAVDTSVQVHSIQAESQLS
jgi:hypothetical protein